MRVYRDTRFGTDKTPYKTNIGIQFRHENAADVHAPGWYVHLDLQSCFVGAGTWHPEPGDLVRIRQRIAEHPKGFTRALEQSQGSGMALVGDSLARPPRGFDGAHPLIDQIRRKDFLLSADLDPGLFTSHALVPELERRFRGTAPFMEWLCQTLGAPF